MYSVGTFGDRVKVATSQLNFFVDEAKEA